MLKEVNLHMYMHINVAFELLHFACWCTLIKSYSNVRLFENIKGTLNSANESIFIKLNFNCNWNFKLNTFFLRKKPWLFILLQECRNPWPFLFKKRKDTDCIKCFEKFKIFTKYWVLLYADRAVSICKYEI